MRWPVLWLGSLMLFLYPGNTPSTNFIFESTGRLHEKADEFFKKVIAIMSENTAVHRLSILSSYWQSRLSMCLQSQISQAIVTRAQHINGGRCGQSNYDYIPFIIYFYNKKPIHLLSNTIQITRITLFLSTHSSVLCLCLCA